MIPGPQEAVILIVVLGYFAGAIWLVLHVLGNRRLRGLVQLIWIGLIVVLPVIGPLSYYLTDYKKTDHDA